jgi:hypothetical protein
MSENKILVRIPFDKSKGEPAPSFEQFGVFYREFGRLFTKEEREHSEVTFSEGSIKIWIAFTIAQFELFDASLNLIDRLNNPQTVKDKAISTNISNSFNPHHNNTSFCFFNCSTIYCTGSDCVEHPVTLKSYDKELSQMQKLESIKYQVTERKITEEIQEKLGKEPTPKKIKKCKALAILLEDEGGFKKGDELQFEVDSLEFCELGKMYVASFIKDGNNWELLNEPMTITQR